LLLPVGRNTYAIDLTDAREVVETPVVTALPTAPPWVLGLFNLRGEVVALLDTGALLGDTPGADVAAVVVVDTPAGAAGLSATARTRTAELGEQIAASRGPAGRGNYRVEDIVVTLLDVAAVVGDPS
jgi:purine-binding chemotaxis protein CheW